MQEGVPIAFASKSLTDAESRYSNIERELLGVLYGLEHFHYYVYGQHVAAHTDHKPLQAIASKNLANAPPRLACILLCTQKYNFTVEYYPAAEVPIADALSRVSLVCKVPCLMLTLMYTNLTPFYVPLPHVYRNFVMPLHKILSSMPSQKWCQVVGPTNKKTALITSLHSGIIKMRSEYRMDCF